MGEREPWELSMACNHETVESHLTSTLGRFDFHSLTVQQRRVMREKELIQFSFLTGCCNWWWLWFFSSLEISLFCSRKPQNLEEKTQSWKKQSVRKLTSVRSTRDLAINWIIIELSTGRIKRARRPPSSARSTANRRAKRRWSER